jgi:cytochrome d ubiquinol oxidase subunit II
VSGTQLAVLLLVAMGAGLTLYVLLGGADFGGGVWDLLARGPRHQDERDLISHALGPVWEANHVWLIFVVTALFAAFPQAFADLAVALYLPFGIALAGIVFRGAAFAFRAHGDPGCSASRRW